MNQINPNQPPLQPLQPPGSSPGLPQLRPLGGQGLRLDANGGFGLKPPASLSSPDQLKVSLGGPLAQTTSLSFLLAKPVDLPIYTTYATPNEVVIRGRALEADTKAPDFDDSWFDNFKRTVRELESDELPDLRVDVSFNGQRYGVTTDREGFFELRLKPNPPLSPGKHRVQAELAPGQAYRALPSFGEVVIHESSASTGVVSDIDDTILQTHVTSKRKLLKGILFDNALELKPMPGMAALYQALERQLDGRLDGDVHYLSGSPVNFDARLDTFMAQNGFPEGSIDLKHLGAGSNTDKLMAQNDYKLGKLRKLFTTFPERRFILIGDSGEKDPEIYRQIQKEFPKQVLGVMINNVTGSQQNDARFEGQLLFDRSSDAAAFAQRQGWIDAEAVRQVQLAESRGL